MSRAKRRPRSTRGQVTPKPGGGSRFSADHGTADREDGPAERSHIGPADQPAARTAPGARPDERSSPAAQQTATGTGSDSTPAERAAVDGGPLRRGPGDEGGPIRPGTPSTTGPRAVRMRVSKGNPWSVMLTSFLLLAGLGVLAVASTLIVWTMLNIMAPEDVPTLATTLTVSAGVVLLEVVLGTCFATLSTFIYNLSSPYHGGVQLAVTDDLTDPTPAAAEALLSLARARARVRRYLRTHTPPWASARGRRPGIGARSGAARPTRPHPAADGPARTTDNADNSREVSDTA